MLGIRCVPNVWKHWSSGAAVEKWWTIWKVKPIGMSLDHQRDAYEGEHRIPVGPLPCLSVAYCWWDEQFITLRSPPHTQHSSFQFLPDTTRGPPKLVYLVLDWKLDNIQDLCKRQTSSWPLSRLSIPRFPLFFPADQNLIWRLIIFFKK